VNLKSLVAAPLCAALIFSTSGCTHQTTTAELIGIVGTSVAALETIEGNTTAATKLSTDFAAAESAVMNWKSGTPTQNVAEALQLIESDLSLLPVTSEDTALIDLAIGTVDQILAIFGTPATPVTTALINGVPAHIVYAGYGQTVTTQHRPVPAVHFKNKKQFKSAWNKILANHPKLAGATIK
jgi:hypothetical protein